MEYPVQNDVENQEWKKRKNRDIIKVAGPHSWARLKKESQHTSEQRKINAIQKKN